jgi:hypothetical protein
MIFLSVLFMLLIRSWSPLRRSSGNVQIYFTPCTFLIVLACTPKLFLTRS